MSTSKGSLSIDDFELGKQLGTGAFGTVYLVREKQSGFICAMKVLDKQTLIKQHSEEQLLSEIKILTQLRFCYLTYFALLYTSLYFIRHPSIIRFYGYFYDDFRIYLITEYCHDGDLFHKLQQVGKFSEHEAAQVLLFSFFNLIYLY